jgi:hypothetical protein
VGVFDKLIEENKTRKFDDTSYLYRENQPAPSNIPNFAVLNKQAELAAAEIDAEEDELKGLSGGQIAGSITAETAISIASEPLALTAATGVGAIFPPLAPISAPLTYLGVKFLAGTGGSILSQKTIEKQDDISDGRAIMSGLINMIPMGKVAKGADVVRKTAVRKIGEQTLKGAGIGAGYTTGLYVIDEQRLPTFEEFVQGTSFGAGAGLGISSLGQGLGVGYSKLYNKFAGKTAKEIDVAIAKGKILQEDVNKLFGGIGNTRFNINTATYSQLKKEARRLKLLNTGKMNKSQLKKAIQNKTKDNRQVTGLPKAPLNDFNIDDVDEAIRLLNSTLQNTADGLGATISRDTKILFKNYTSKFMGDFQTLVTAKSQEEQIKIAKVIIERLPKYRKFDKTISAHDYNTGASLQAKSAKAEKTIYENNISARANQRAKEFEDLQKMLEDFVAGKPLSKEIVDYYKKFKIDLGNPKKAKDEQIRRMMVHLDNMYNQTKKEGGVLGQAVDSYFSARLLQALNATKTAFVGVPSATITGITQPIINTPANIQKAYGLNVPLSKKLQYASADLFATTEYFRAMLPKYGVYRGMANTYRNQGESNFIYRDRHGFMPDISFKPANEMPWRVQNNLRKTKRIMSVEDATANYAEYIKRLNANIMNSKLGDTSRFFFNHGMSLLGSLEEATLMGHAYRSLRASGIKEGIENGVDDVKAYSDDYINNALNRSDKGEVQFNYDPKYADDINEVRRAHFRTLDIDPDDIRNDIVDNMVKKLTQVQANHDEAGIIARTVMMFVGVPLRATRESLAYSPFGAVPVLADLTRRGAARVDKKLTYDFTGRRNVSFGKYESEIGKAETIITKQQDIVNSTGDPKTKQEALIQIAKAKEEIKELKQLRREESYQQLGKLSIGMGIFFYGYEMAKQGHATGTMAFLTDEQRFDMMKVQGAPKPFKNTFNEAEYDYRYFDPIKLAYAFGADYAMYTSLKEQDMLTEDQTFDKFLAGFIRAAYTESPFAQGIKQTVGMTSDIAEVRERALESIVSGLIPVPSEIRRYNTFQQEFIPDYTNPENMFEDSLSKALGKQVANYRLDALGSPLKRQEPNLLNYLISFSGRKVVKREPIDDVLLTDAITFGTITDTPKSFERLNLMEFVNEDGQTLYSFYGNQINKKTGVISLRQELNQAIKTTAFKNLYKNNGETKSGGYVMTDAGQKINLGIQEVIKPIIANRRKIAREKILNPNNRIARDFVNKDGKNIYDIIKERQSLPVVGEGNVLDILGL